MPSKKSSFSPPSDCSRIPRMSYFALSAYTKKSLKWLDFKDLL